MAQTVVFISLIGSRLYIQNRVELIQNGFKTRGKHDIRHKQIRRTNIYRFTYYQSLSPSSQACYGFVLGLVLGLVDQLLGDQVVNVEQLQRGEHGYEQGHREYLGNHNRWIPWSVCCIKLTGICRQQIGPCGASVWAEKVWVDLTVEQVVEIYCSCQNFGNQVAVNVYCSIQSKV